MTKDRYECPYRDGINCHGPDGVPIRKINRPCDTCAWGPHAEAICRWRIAKVMMKIRKEQGNGKRTRKVQK